MVVRIVISLILAVPVAVQAAEVRLRSSAACNSTVVRVADIAEVFGDDARVTAALRDIPLCPAPAPACQRLLSQHDVRQLLALSGVERAAAQVTGSESVTLLGESPTGASPLPKRPLVAGGVRQALFEAEATKQPPKPTAAATVVAKQAAAPLVARGSTVSVHALAAGVRVTTSGKALDTGGAGDAVSVELADSKQRVLGRVTGPQVVEVSVNSATHASATLR